MAALVHRGPDDSGRFEAGAVAMGFQRLAIIDLTPGGHQPMRSADGHHVIVFNGEIFNYRELRTELQGLGQRFVSDSDTEVLLAAYRQWGRACVDRFNGMFAFVIHDLRDGTLFGARDRLGEKPLYTWQDEHWTVLASEPAAIGATGLTTLRPDWARLGDALRYGAMDHTGGSCLADIRPLPAAHTLAVERSGVMRQARYWSAPTEALPDDRPSDADWVDELSALVGDAVRLRLRSDVPVGFTLSGGIDSSLLICEAALLGNAGLDAFTYQDSLYDERSLIAETVARTGARQHLLDAADLDVAALLPKVVAANGEPVHSLSAVANYVLFQRARERGVKVLIGGQGADEVFAGYRSFERDRWQGLALAGHWRALLADIRRSARLHGASSGQLARQVAARALRFALGRTRPYRLLRDARLSAAPGRSYHPAFTAELWQADDAEPPPPMPGARLIDCQRRALDGTPLPMYLRIEDRVSMAHSVEARLPFADHRLVEHALRLPERLKYDGGVNKVALRAVASRRVPAAVAGEVRKLGFPVGHSERTAAGLQALCRELASTQAFRERGVYDRAGVDALLSRPPRPADVTALFNLAQVELWLTGLAAARLAR